jgi:hypothetical protein
VPAKSPLFTDLHSFYVSARLERDRVSTRAIEAYERGDNDTGELLETLTRLIEEVEDELRQQSFTR